MNTKTERIFVTGAMGSTAQPAGIRPAAQPVGARPAARDLRAAPASVANKVFAPAYPIRTTVLARLHQDGTPRAGRRGSPR